MGIRLLLEKETRIEGMGVWGSNKSELEIFLEESGIA